jgi:hypothetical protein
MIDQIAKEELIRARLDHLGFDLTRAGFGWIVRDRREKLGIPALQPTHSQNLDTIVALGRAKSAAARDGEAARRAVSRKVGAIRPPYRG